MKNASVIPLLDKWEKFIEENPRSDMYVFADWLSAEKRFGKKAESVSENKKDVSNAVQSAILITRLRCYLGMYVKPAVKELGLYERTRV